MSPERPAGLGNQLSHLLNPPEGIRPNCIKATLTNSYLATVRSHKSNSARSR
jgi:hypothetical protein